MTDRVDCIVIGAGVVGLAVARAVAFSGREVIVVETADTIGSETSSRHSEVIHAGIYYPQDSLKAKFCVEGKHALYEFCDGHGVSYKRCGKIIVATDEEQLPELEQLKANAAANGVEDLTWMTPQEVIEMEPAVFCVGALWSPSTGILDSHSFMLALQGDAEEAGAMFAFLTPVTGGEVQSSGIRIDCGGAAPMSLAADLVINCGGLWAQSIASKINGIPAASVPPTYYCKGNYYTLSGRPPFSRPIYPVPEKAGLGVHVTVDLGGQVRFGPDVEWIDRIDYDVDPDRADKFYDAVRKYYPGLADGAIQPGYSGIRPKIQAPGEPAKDFVIQGSDEHGVAGLINLYGIESPGMTSSLAIADHVAKMI
ncbi:MAG: NAD(P)/FAD-dependent oxidoreductase [Alphaproteobacteria bacterium]